MLAVIQRVAKAKVEVDGDLCSSIGRGYVVFLGVARGDGERDIDFIVRKLLTVRLFEGLDVPAAARRDFDRSIQEVNGEILLVSQFTLLGDCRKGRRPDWTKAAGADEAEPIYNEVIDRLRASGVGVKEGRFGAKMLVSLVNDGPVTILLDSKSGKVKE